MSRIRLKEERLAPFNYNIRMRLIAWLRLLLCVGLISGVALALLLAFGMNNPPLAGDLRVTTGKLESMLIPTNSYTVVIAAKLPPEAPFSARWGILLLDAQQQPIFRVEVTADGYFRYLPGGDDLRAFPHLKADYAELSLHVERDGRATLRLNREIAWRGTLQPTAQIDLLYPKAAELHVAYIRLYTP